MKALVAWSIFCAILICPWLSLAANPNIALPEMPKKPLEVVQQNGRGTYLIFEPRNNFLDTQKIEDFIDKTSAKVRVNFRRSFIYCRISEDEDTIIPPGRVIDWSVTGRFYPGRQNELPIIYSVLDFDSHELAHMVISELSNAPEPGFFWHEGLATFLAREPKYNLAEVKAEVRRVGGITEVINKAAQKNGFYQPIAGAFVAYLAESYGLDKVVEFFKVSTRKNSNEVFLRIFRKTVKEAGTEWLK